MVPQRIEREILIEAPVEVVWEVVTQPEHISGWFSDSVELDLTPGGAMLLRWSHHGAVPGRVEVGHLRLSCLDGRASPPNYCPGQGHAWQAMPLSAAPARSQTRLRRASSDFLVSPGSRRATPAPTTGDLSRSYSYRGHSGEALELLPQGFDLRLKPL